MWSFCILYRLRWFNFTIFVFEQSQLYNLYIIEIAPLIKIDLLHRTFFLIWEAPTHFEWTVGWTSWSSFLVLRIFKNFICTEFDFSATTSKYLSITTPMLWWMEWIKGFCMLLCIAATCTWREFWMLFRTLIRNSLIG